MELASMEKRAYIVAPKEAGLIDVDNWMMPS